MKKLLILTICLYSSISWSKPDRSRYEILPTDPTTSTITKKLFHTVINRVESLYNTEFASKGLLVDFNADWDKSYFTAWAHNDDPPLYSVNFWGGIARIPGVNEYGWVFAVCHEVGHLLGGYPKNSHETLSWATAEGQSDYFASAHCLKRYFDAYPYRGKPVTVSKVVKEGCNGSKHCLNSAKAALNFKIMIRYLMRDTPKLSLETPSTVTPEKTIVVGYPDAQCRLDTILESSKCNNDYSSLEDWVCKEGIGKRSACWYKAP